MSTSQVESNDDLEEMSAVEEALRHGLGYATTAGLNGTPATNTKKARTETPSEHQRPLETVIPRSHNTPGENTLETREPTARHQQV